MRIIIFLLLIVCCGLVKAQQTVVSTGHIQIGIQVKKTKNVTEATNIPGANLEAGDLYDIATLSEGFNEYGLPIRLVIPYGAEIILFSPTIKKTNADKYRFRQGTGASHIATEFDYVYKGDSVTRFNPRFTERGNGYVSIEEIQRVITASAPSPNGLMFTFRVDKAPLRFNDIYLFSEAKQLSSAAMEQLNNPSTIRYRDYSIWLAKGYTESLDLNGFPVDPSFPYTEEGFFMETTGKPNSGNVFLVGGGEYKRIDEDSELTPNMLIIGAPEPGAYRLVLEEPEKKYGEKSIYFTFTIKSSFWDRGGYLLAILLPLFLFLFLLYRFYTKRKIKKIDLLQRLSEAELKAIRAQLNPHFLFNALNAIQNLVNKGETDAANDYIVKLSRLLRLVLSQSDDTFHSLSSEIEISRLYLELEKMRTPFTYTIKVEGNVDENMLIPSMILQPYLENAVAHGVVKNSATKIDVSIFYQDESCILEIENDGENVAVENLNGKGMQLGNERLEIIKRQFGNRVKANAQVRILPNGGFRVTITIPKDL